MLLSDLALHDTTRMLLEAYQRTPKQGILLSGDSGSGLGTTASVLASAITSKKSAVVTVVPDEKGTIPIDVIRGLYRQTRGRRNDKQVVVVDNADNMSHDAANAFLKLLEEPGANVHFILTAHNPTNLPSTILSRVEQVMILPISAVDSQSLLRRHRVSDATLLQQMLFMASGRPAELTRLATNAAYCADRSVTVRLARDFLAANTYDRMKIVVQLKTRHDALEFVQTLAKLLEFVQTRQQTSTNTKTVTGVEQVMSRLMHNGHVKTQLLHLSLLVYNT